VDLCDKQWLTRPEIRRLASELAPALSRAVLDTFLDRYPHFAQERGADGVARFKAAQTVTFLEGVGCSHSFTIQPGVLLGAPPPPTEPVALC
jgi:hypothetical protein